MPENQLKVSISEAKESDSSNEEDVLNYVKKKLKELEKKVTVLEKENKELTSKIHFIKHNIEDSITKEIPLTGNTLAWFDDDTGLMWEVKNKTSIEKTYNFATAQKYAKVLNKIEYAGFNDWRIPTKTELETIIMKTKNNGLFIKPPLSQNSKYIYWTSTKYDTQTVWVTYFYYGYSELYNGNVNLENYVRCVRGGWI